MAYGRNVLEYDIYENFNKGGSSLQGGLVTTYDKLVDQFGKPSYTCGDPYEKVSCEWVINAKVLDDFAERMKTIGTMNKYRFTFGSMDVFLLKNVSGISVVITAFAQDIIETIFAKNLKPEYSEVS